MCPWCYVGKRRFEQARQANEQMTRTAAVEGLEFRFDRIRGGNTFDAHRLLHLACAV